jgi:hypothetical protein
MKNGKKPDYSLGDYIAIELLTRYGGPMRLKAISAALRGRGIEAKESNIIRAMLDDPEKFKRDGYGLYKLNPELVRD